MWWRTVVVDVLVVVLRHGVCPFVAGLGTLATVRYPEGAQVLAELVFR